ncbi:hypothetical protein BU25DRAFT_494832 [Macroventuria anomochaeta]|uniref:Uncharacterized protein n=1 Tax=Macroventuria anomochaeta TaxID=301207 RepID=A0ACB6RLF7_9PLEO|nr:uncharacterized protein BU25DRAFT_494832 [Macroventuria anomochaeta]KAF2622751.1 hypothetical protein BU25DRAFT_494832 [Macroventuria anomochaeta]
MSTFRSMIMFCRTIQAETELVLYSTNIFCYTCDSDWTPWIRLLDQKKRNAIRTVQMDYYGSYRFIYSTLSSLLSLSNLKMIIFRSGSGLGLFKQAVQEYAQARKWQVIFDDLPPYQYEIGDNIIWVGSVDPGAGLVFSPTSMSKGLWGSGQHLALSHAILTAIYNTCRQIRFETQDLYYKLNIFYGQLSVLVSPGMMERHPSLHHVKVARIELKATDIKVAGNKAMGDEKIIHFRYNTEAKNMDSQLPKKVLNRMRMVFQERRVG